MQSFLLVWDRTCSLFIKLRNIAGYISISKHPLAFNSFSNYRQVDSTSEPAVGCIGVLPLYAAKSATSRRIGKVGVLTV